MKLISYIIYTSYIIIYTSYLVTYMQYYSRSQNIFLCSLIAPIDKNMCAPVNHWYSILAIFWGIFIFHSARLYTNFQIEFQSGWIKIVFSSVENWAEEKTIASLSSCIFVKIDWIRNVTLVSTTFTPQARISFKKITKSIFFWKKMSPKKFT